MSDTKRLSAVVLFVLAGCKHTPPPRTAPPVVTKRDANAAYEHKDYAKCGPLYEQVAADARPGAELSLYDAACCRALAGDAAAAFADLDRAIAAGFLDRRQIERDEDLVSLRGDPRWAQMLAGLDRAQEVFERSLPEAALRRELLALVDEDQQARNAWIQAPNDEAARDRVLAIDTKTTARLKEVVAKLGWPGKTLVGKDGAKAAWLLVQHADAAPDFQKQCLALMERAVAAGEASEVDYAYLYDRVAVHEHRPQRYGTQFSDGEPDPIEDPAHVDERRKALGLPTMAEYAEQMRRMYGSGAVAPPSEQAQWVTVPLTPEPVGDAGVVRLPCGSGQMPPAFAAYIHALPSACSLKLLEGGSDAAPPPNINVSIYIREDGITGLRVSGADTKTLSCITSQVRSWRVASTCPASSEMTFRLRFAPE